MKQSKFTDSQIMEALKRVEAGVPAPEICREYGISTATFYKWRAKYGGLDVLMMSRMKELEAENIRLKRMYAEERLKADILKEILEKKPGHLDAARWPRNWWRTRTLRYDWPVKSWTSAKPAIDTRLGLTARMLKLPTG